MAFIVAFNRDRGVILPSGNTATTVYSVGGTSWSGQDIYGLHTNERQKGVVVMSESKAVMCGKGGSSAPKVRHTIDGGVTWVGSVLTGGTTTNGAANFLIKIDSTTVILISINATSNPEIWKSVDGGAFFTFIATKSGFEFFAYDFITGGTGCYMGFSNPNQMYISTDFGLTEVPFGNPITISSTAYRNLKVFDANTAFVFQADNQRLLKTFNGGVGYFDIDLHVTIPAADTVQRLRYVDQNIIYAVTTGNIYKTIDGGINWTATGTAAEDIAMMDDVRGYLVVGSEVRYSGDSFATTTLSYTLPANKLSFDNSNTFNLISVGGDEDVNGCTDPNSCNYDAAATVDDGSCNYRYILVSCDDPSVTIITDTDLSAEVGNTVDVAGVCYVVSYYTDDCIAGTGNRVNISGSFEDCSACQGVKGCTDPNSCNYNPLATIDDRACDYRYILTDCDSVEADIITDSDLSAYVGQSINLDGDETCWSVAYYTADCNSYPNVAGVVNSYSNCQTCIPPIFILPSKPTLSIDSDCSLIEITDTVDYDSSTELGHLYSDYKDYKVLTITRWDGTTYVYSSLGDGDEIISAPFVDNSPTTYNFLDSDEDGVWSVEICSYPTWRDDVEYSNNPSSEIVVYYDGNLYLKSSIDTSYIGVTPDSNSAMWILYTPTEEEKSISRYCNQEKIVFLCRNIIKCYENKVHSVFCMLDESGCNNDVLCEDEVFLSAFKIRLLLDSIEISTDGLMYDDVVKDINLIKKLCC